MQDAVAGSVLWHLRILAGWVPETGVRVLRVLAGGFEIANVDQHLVELSGGTARPPFRMGMLATAWPRLAGTASTAQVRLVLSGSPWGDPGGNTAHDIRVGMRLAWARRVCARIPEAAGWALAATALLLATERFVGGRPAPAGARRLLGSRAEAASSIDEVAAALPPAAAWVLDGVTRPVDLWRAQARWWRRVRTDGDVLLARPGFAAAAAVGAAAVLAGDAFLVRAALEVAARGGGALEDFDALA